MRILQPAEWSKPRGFSHGVAVDGPGRWIVLAGQTGGDEKGEYQPDMAGQVGVALRRIIKLLAEAGAGPEHIVRLTWYLTSRSEYEAAGAGIGAAWRETLGRNFPPSTLLYIDGLVDVSAPRSRSKSPRSFRHRACMIAKPAWTPAGPDTSGHVEPDRHGLRRPVRTARSMAPSGTALRRP